jgi:hypothetical protein
MTARTGIRNNGLICLFMLEIPGVRQERDGTILRQTLDLIEKLRRLDIFLLLIVIRQRIISGNWSTVRNPYVFSHFQQH